MKLGNILSGIPENLREEIFEGLVEAPGVRVERIVSSGQASPEGFWYDQDDNEWVMVVKGSAGLCFEGVEEIVVLKPGDWIDIPARVRHRVEWTDPEERTVWLAVFY